MKNMKNSTDMKSNRKLTTLIIAAALTLTPFYSAFSSTAFSSVKQEINMRLVTKDMVIQYLKDNGYNPLTVEETETGDWFCTNCNDTYVMVYVVDGCIAGHQDIDI
jgi:hypothetical protein